MRNKDYSLSLSMKKKMEMIVKALQELVLAWELWLVPGINTSSVPICSHSSSGFQCNPGDASHQWWQNGLKCVIKIILSL
jgi:hypothetical protein